MEASSGVVQPRQFTIMTTNTCTAECAHCSVHSSPTRRGALTDEQIICAIDAVHRRGPLTVVIFAGGEPTLLGQHLLNAIAHVDSLDLISRLVTNAHWATSAATARARVAELRNAGLRELNISCDDHHIPYIPLDRVCNAWNAAKHAGFDAVVIASASGPNSHLTPTAIQELLGEEMPLAFDDSGYATPRVASGRTMYLLSNANIQLLGRACATVESSSLSFPVHQDVLDQPCKWIQHTPALSPTNHLLSCCGTEANGKPHLDYGDLGTDTVDGLLDRANDSVIVNAIATVGPYRLMKFLHGVEPTLQFRSLYSGVCEVCEHLFSRAEVVAALEQRLPELATAVLLAKATSRKQLLETTT